MAEPPAETGSPSARNRRADPRYVGKDLATQCVHAGERWERPEFWSSSTPIYNATTFVYDRAEDLDDVVWRRKPGYSYSRSGSPTMSALERALSTLEGVEVTRVCGSGMAIMVNPARTTHRWLSPEQQVALGIGPGTFRMSVGIEGVDDLLEDLDQALHGCQTG